MLRSSREIGALSGQSTETGHPGQRPRTDRFMEARRWGAPFIGSDTVILAPFGWTGLVRSLGRLCHRRLGDTQICITLLSVMPTGVSIEIAGSDLGEHWSALHHLAQEAGNAAPAIDPETGLLTRASLREWLGYVDDRLGHPAAPLEFAALLSKLSSSSKPERRRCAEDVRRIVGGIPPADVKSAPLLTHWKLEFPIGEESVEIVGGLGSVADDLSEPLIAVDHLQRWVRTSRRLYRLREQRSVTFEKGRSS